MAKAKKRKPDLRRIRPTKIYALPEIAEGLDRDIATVRRWIAAGLPVLDGSKPTLVDGADLRSWLKDYWEARKRKCALDELYCLKCREPRRPKPGSASIQIRNSKTLSIKAVCPICERRMNKAGSLAMLAEIEARFRAFMPDMQRLDGCKNTSVDRTSKLARLNGKLGGQIELEFGTEMAPEPSHQIR